MSHEVESAFYVHEPAWHGLGNVLTKAPTIEEGIKMAGLDWKVIERPIYTDPTMEYGVGDEKNSLPNATHIWTHKAIVRETDESVLGVVGRTYTPVQNSEAFQFFDQLLESGDATLEAGGSLKEGQRIWVLAKMKNEGEVVKGDEVKSHLLLSNSHDGMMSLWIQFTPIRVVCMNTLTAAMASRYSDYKIGKAIRLRHAPSVTEGLELAKTLINTSAQTFNASMEAYKFFSSVPMSDDQFNKYLGSIFNQPKTEEVEVEEMLEPRSSKRTEMLNMLFESGAGTDIKAVRGTVWNGYNAITEWVQHYRGYLGGEGRLDASWFGEGATIRTKAFTEAMKYAKTA